ncbi:MAG: SufS family cysteine desulfurase [Acidimicrobiales bacterium]|jgi:cysteine desulfurase/selenocysteine lyase|nr:cysteine desulfurase [Actinomycetota bacterium]MCH2626992.1 SufS family cysteine desulfurase [Acidimicrobiales bacterium]MEC9115014.1 SufS family cysteine desulfurase [Actinomycetota bacterium]MEE2680041.1 SufS family cysteine desulfurase [Actinomycetota bacterium]|tara:strand:- start:2678 stop:3907 length:1230 start_codon:yes stop_codon:yes gene_type:complete
MTLPSDLKDRFPLLSQIVNGHEIVYLDSAASSQKPDCVIDAMNNYYETINANVHRGAYEIAAQATEEMEQARRRIASFIGCQSPHEVVFTKNATESFNLIARSWGGSNLSEGDAVLITDMEHHANIVPWQILSAEKGFEIRWLPLTPDGLLDLDQLDQLLDGVKMVSVTAMSNVLGTLNPVSEIAERAHAAGALVAVDGSQYVPHLPTDIQELQADLLCFTGHKMCGPTGIGVLWGREELLDSMPPFLGGGEMILDVRRDGFTPNELPHKFEAGTPPIAEIIGLGAAVDFLDSLGMENVRQHEIALTDYALRSLNDRYGDEIVIHGPSDPLQRGGVISLEYRDVHPHDLSQVLDQRGICIRAGHHCAKPLMKELGVVATSRASMYLYNDESDVDALVDSLESAGEMFAL